MDRSIALYIHFPFCLRKCNYCSFISYQGQEAKISQYVDAVKREVFRYRNLYTVGSIYIGGGTPSLLVPEQLGDLLSTVHSLFSVSRTAEVTIEANPGTVNEEYLYKVRESGINRLSLGIQSLDDGELALLGRIHSSEDARDAVRLARNAGITNLNLDVIYGVPQRPLSKWESMLQEIINMKPEHMSLYPLTLEDDVPLQLAIKRGEVSELDSDHTADEYEMAEELLAAHEYHHYEISNWAREGYECRHNLVYWQCLPYLGVGVAAHSYLDGHRFANTVDLDKYLEMSKNGSVAVHEMDEEIGEELQLAEAVILGLRLADGVNLEVIRKRFGIDLLQRYKTQVKELISYGLISQEGQSICLTHRGRLLGNEVFWRFLPE